MSFESLPRMAMFLSGERAATAPETAFEGGKQTLGRLALYVATLTREGD